MIYTYINPRAWHGVPTRKQFDLADSVHTYARERFEQGKGWDYISECWTRLDLAHTLACNRINSERAALREFRLTASLYAEQASNCY